MEAKSVDVHAIFRVYTACPHDVPWIVLDLRHHKDFKRSHLIRSFCVRLSSNGAVLLDYSKANYDLTWSNDCWWGKQVLLYGSSGLKRDHPVVDFLSKEGRCKTLLYYRDGYEEIERVYPFLCTTSIKGSWYRYPSQIVPNLLYLGDWSHAEAHERLVELNIKCVITIHNHPENLKLPAGRFKHIKFELPDIDTADIAQYFNATYEAVEEARHRKYAVLVHCGAGVSRSATLVMAVLMRQSGISAAKAREQVMSLRSLVCPNDGFWGTLCALEGPLGIKERSDPTATAGGRGADVSTELSVEVLGGKVAVKLLSASEVKRQREEEREAKEAKRARIEDSRTELGPSVVVVPQKAGGGVLVTFEVSKPEGVVGGIALGPLTHAQRAVFGRAPGSDVLVEHLSVSRSHAAITTDMAGRVFVTDLESGHGTQLDGMWIRANTPKGLSVGSKLSFGASTRIYKVLSITKASVEKADK